ncbi:hypothetical protein HanPI659440_Chr16g0654361 [Helianthus annuus]|nr:hypothetical protein HanPI659440_Chr16g0654361 [Helianthus annuus]
MPANVFGKPKKNTDFMTYKGDGFKLSIPAKWNPSKEVEYPGQVLRYEDNFDTTSNLAVIITPTNKKSITDYGAPEEFLSQVIKSIISVSRLLRNEFRTEQGSRGSLGPGVFVGFLYIKYEFFICIFHKET